MPKRVVVSKVPESNIVNNMKVIGEHVQYTRTKMNITIQDAAALCNISHRTYMSIEKGEGKVRIDTVLSVLSILGLKLQIIDGKSHE